MANNDEVVYCEDDIGIKSKTGLDKDFPSLAFGKEPIATKEFLNHSTRSHLNNKISQL